MAEVVRLVAEVVVDSKGQISRNKVDCHVQNWSCHLTSGGTTNLLLTDNIQCEMFLGFRSLPIRRPTLLIVRRGLVVRAKDTLNMLTLRRAEGREFDPRPGQYSRMSFSSDQVTGTVFPRLNMPFSSWESINYKPYALLL